MTRSIINRQKENAAAAAAQENNAREIAFWAALRDGLEALHNSGTDITEWPDEYTSDTWYADGWKDGGMVTRRIKKILLEHNYPIKSTRYPALFSECVEAEFGDETLARFLVAWDSMIYPEGYTALSLAAAPSSWCATLPESFPPGLRKHGEKLATVICNLETLLKKWAHLSSRKAGEICGIHYTAAAPILNLLVKHGVLERRVPPGARLAHEYHYLDPTDRDSTH